MSLDKSLRARARLKRSRNVLTRAERILKLEEEGRWLEGDSPFGLPSVRVRRAKVKKRKEEKPAAADGTAEAAAAPAATEKKK